MPTSPSSLRLGAVDRDSLARMSHHTAPLDHQPLHRFPTGDSKLNTPRGCLDLIERLSKQPTHQAEAEGEQEVSLT